MSRLSRVGVRRAVGLALASGTAAAAVASGPATAAAPAAPSEPGPVTVSKTVTRSHLTNGADSVVDSRNVTLKVSSVQNLRSRQVLDVSWTGAHPTANLFPDPNSSDARNEEYPFLLMECRGLDDPAAPPAARMRPETCWTQTPNERYVEDYNTAFPPYRVDRYATADQRKASAGLPDGVTTSCASSAAARRFVPFVDSTGKVYPGGTGSCAVIAPEESYLTTTGRPGDTTYATTGADGSGSTEFTTWTAEDNASLGCSTTVPCSLVAVPVMGISCDIAANSLPPEDRPSTGDETVQAQKDCTATGRGRPSSISTGQSPFDQAVSGGLWWSESNWRNRLTIPLDFAPLSNVCDLVSTAPEVQVYGSELLAQATGQWTPALCSSGSTGYKVKHVQTGEPQARNILQSGSTEAAFTSRSQPGGWVTPTVTAPTAITGFALTFKIDDASGKPVTDLRLTPRLIAKLLTESYPAVRALQDNYAAIGHNPQDLALDPEFKALNPSVPTTRAEVSASTALILSSDSDVIHALTSYIAADPEAAAWLAGTPDPWGMVVNPHYKIGSGSALTLPTDNWPLLDTYEDRGFYAASNQCLADNPVPYLPLVAAPVQRLSAISVAMQYSLANSQVVCVQPGSDSAGEKLVSLGRQTPGFRFMIGLTSLGDAARYSLPVAQLETRTATDAPTKFTDATGRDFAAGTTAGLKAAIDTATPDEASGTWVISPTTLRQGASTASAYPGTMLVSTAVPTARLPQADADRYAQFLRFIAGPAQVPGTDVGQLPAGYLPMSAGSGQQRLAAYTLKAADAVAAQKGEVPALSPTTGSPSASGVSSSSASAAPLAGPTSGTARGSSPTRTAPRVAVRPTKSGVRSLAPSTAVTAVAAAPAAPVPVPAGGGAMPGGVAAQDGSGPTLPASTPPMTRAGQGTVAPAVGDPAKKATPAAAVASTPLTGAGGAGAVLPLLLLLVVAGAALAGGDLVLGRRRSP